MSDSLGVADAAVWGTGSAAGELRAHAHSSCRSWVGERDRPLTPLQVAVAGRAVEIENAVLDVREQLEVEGALVDCGHDRLGLVCDEGQEVAHGIERPVDAPTDGVAYRQRRHRGEDEVGSRPDAIHRQCLAEIGFAGLDVHERCDVDEPRNANRRVDGEPRQLAACAERPPLEEVVHEPAGHVQIVDQSREAAAGRVRADLRPPLRCRLDQVAIEDVVVEGEHVLVEGLPGIVVGLVLRLVRQRGALREAVAPHRAIGSSRPGRHARRASAAGCHADSNHDSEKPHDRGHPGWCRVLHGSHDSFRSSPRLTSRYIGHTSRQRHDPERDDYVDQNDVDGH